MISTLPAGLIPLHAVGAPERLEMYRLLTRHFAGVTWGQFERDLAAKNWVIHVHRHEVLVGFSSLLVSEEQFDGQSIIAIYSGDTIVAPEAWNSPALARAWIAAVNHLRAEHPERRCYWLLLTSGFRTYRLLPVFWREFFPHHALKTPHRMQRLMEHLARARYGSSYDPAVGLVRFASPQALREPLAEIPSGREADPHVAFFLARNPGHRYGDELVCITEIAESNLTPAGRRMSRA